MRSLEREVLLAFPEQAVQRMAFVSKLPVGWSRSSVDGAMKRLLKAGLIERVGRGVYALTEAGRMTRRDLRPLVQKAG